MSDVKPLNALFKQSLAAIVAAGFVASAANAQTITVVHTNAPTAPGSNAILAVRFTAGATAVSSMDINFSIARPPVAASNVSFTAGTVTNAGFILCGGSAVGSTSGTGYNVQAADTSPPNDPLGTVGTPETICTFTVPIAVGATSVNNIPVTAEFANTTGGGSSTANSTFNLTIGAGPSTPPTISYAPNFGSTITYTGAGTAAPIVATPSGGAGSGAAATTTVGACNITGGGAAFPTTTIAQLSFVGPTTTAQNLNLPNCAPQAAAVNATLTCPETQGAGAAVNRVWTLTCPAGAANTAPTVTYNPTAGTTINFPAGAAGAATSSVTVTSAGGTGTGSVTVNNCTATAGFTVTNAPINLTGTAGGAQINGAVNLSCTRGGAVQNGTLSCTETPTPAVGGSPFTRSWPLVCPAATVANVPPTLTYNPAPSVSAVPPGGPFTSIAYGASANIQVLCASPSPDGTACGGSGVGDPATARLQNISVAFIGPPFSPVPNNLSCVFANQANGTVASPLNFVATQADPGNIRCTCANNPTSGDNYRVSVQEISPVGGATVTRNFDITCGGAGVVCGSLTATPPSGNITLNNGGAAVQVTALQAAGITAPNTRSVTCAVTGASAGSTFTVTPASPISVAGTAVNVTASCANTATTTGTATLTCTAAANNPLQGCPALTATYTLTCPGVVAPPVVPVEPVPVMSDAGRMLLASLVLLLGLVAVGFRLRN
jgi:hypothetical protein